jgi:hypothetical protein
MLGRTLSAIIAMGMVVAMLSAASPVPSEECDPASNLAECAVATANSENPDTQQTADKAIDGIADGYPGDYTTEWATIGGREDSTLTLTWPSPQLVGSVVLFDRPNTDDNITGATLEFSDGSTVLVPPLPESGEPLALEFPPREASSLLFTVTSVSSSTYNIGLSEIEVLPEQAIASLLGTARNFTQPDSALQVRPTAVATIDTDDDDVRLLRLELELEGLGGTATVGPSDFAIVDGTGTRYHAVKGPDDDVEPLGDHSLDMWETAAGAVYFELPMQARGLLIAYWPSANERAVATWTLSAP